MNHDIDNPAKCAETPKNELILSAKHHPPSVPPVITVACPMAAMACAAPAPCPAPRGRHKAVHGLLLLTAATLTAMMVAAAWWVHRDAALPPDAPFRDRFAEKTARLPGHLQILYRETEELYANGRTAAANRRLQPELLRILTLRHAPTAYFHAPLLALYWRYNLGADPDQVKQQCREVLSFAPDHLEAKLTLGRLLPQDFNALLEHGRDWPETELRSLKANIAELKQARELADYAPEIDWILALTDTALWLKAGEKGDPGALGFAEREEALALCRQYPNRRDFTRLRHDILYRINGHHWLLINDRVIEERMTTRPELRKTVRRLARRLR